jgi:serine protease AprX
MKTLPLRAVSILGLLVPLAAVSASKVPVSAAASSVPVSVVVAGHPGGEAQLAQSVRSIGGHVTRRIGIIHGVVASVPEGSLERLRTSAGVASVSRNDSLRPQSALPGSGYEQTATTTSMYSTTLVTGAQEYWKRGFTGKGVDVAIIDTGVLEQNGLTGRVINGPDLSFESQDVNRRYKDGYGHGTHLAGIIAGKDDGVSTLVGNSAAFIGMAPDARIVNVKVGDGNGTTDVSQVIAAVDWIVQNRNANGMNIKVLELAYSTDSNQDYLLSPLTYALEVAWQKGITVVVAAGNDGKASGLAMPAIDPWVLSVGAADTKGTISAADDSVANFSSTGKASWVGRGPDVVAPGISLPSLRVPGGKADTGFPGARIGDRFFKGSGTSQASAVVAGAVALIAQERPNATPDQIKGELKLHALWLQGETTGTMGQGEINLAWVLGVYDLGWPEPLRLRATGLGSIDGTRGSHRPTLGGAPLTGDKDIFGKSFSSISHAQAANNTNAWAGGSWNGSTWTGSTWTGSTWTGSTWTGSTWTGSTWTGNTWTGSSWTGSSWTGSAWSSVGWS